MQTFVAAPGADVHAGLSPAAVFDSVLQEHPEAYVNAMNDHAVVVDLPPALAARVRRTHEATSAMDVFAPQDWPAVITAWETAQLTGAGRATVHLVSDGQQRTMHVLDLRAEHGVLVGVHHVAEQDEAPAAAPAPDVPLVTRYAQVRKDARAFLTEVDANAERLFGRPAEELLGRRASDLVHPEDRELALRSWMEMLASPGLSRRVLLRHLRGNGQVLWLEVTNHNLLEDPAHGHVVADLVDVTEQMVAQETARARQELLDRLAETVPVGLLQLDLAGAVVYANTRLYEIVGRPAASTVEEQLAQLAVHDRPGWERALAGVLQGGRSTDLELTFTGAPAARVCSAALRALRDRDGHVSGAIVCLTDTTRSARVRAQLHERATYDALTGCLNRASVLSALDEAVRQQAPGTGTALAYCDLDGFKQVNDRYGHAAGDAVLQEVARRLAGFVRDGQVVGRLGGDEFLVVLPDLAGDEEARAVGQRLSRALSGPFTLPGSGPRSGSGVSVPVEASVGTVWMRAATADTLVAQADRAMYRSKRSRRAAGRRFPRPGRLFG